MIHSSERDAIQRDGHTVFFVGVVEDTADPMQIGRVRVRAIGIHPEKGEGAVPTEHLPWAYVMLPTTASGMSGIGSTHGLIDGSWVAGYFLDGRDAQQPVVIGTFVGAPGVTQSQRDIMGSGLGVSSLAAGPMGGYFQTALTSATGGLGAPTKYGPTVGGLLNLANFFKNEDAVSTLEQASSVYNTSGKRPEAAPAVSKVMDRATAAEMTTAVSQASSAFKAVPGLGVSTLLNAGNALMSLLSAGGATGFIKNALSPLSGASFGSIGQPGDPMSGSNATVGVRTDYDALFASAAADTGALVVHGTGTTKHANYTVDSLRKGTLDLDQFDYIIDTTGQVIKGSTSSQSKNKYSIGGQGASGVTVALVGGKNGNSSDGRGTLESLYWPVQLQVLEKMTEAFLRKYPNGSVTGAGEVGAGSAGFNVSEWARNKFPKNANSPTGGTQRITGTFTDTVGALAQDDSNVQSESGFQNASFTSPGGTRLRGFQGGPSHPIPAYATRRESDVPAQARTNALTTGRGSVATDAGSGGPGNQYVAVQEEPSQYSYPKARSADTLEARQIPETWKTPVYPHGGEYGRAHVVRSTEGGHHILLDDTSGRQKVEILHSTGSMMQIQADGSGIFFIKKDGYEVVLGDKSVGVNGSLHLSVGGDMKVSVQGNLAYDVTGKITFNGSSDMTELIRGNRSTVTEGSHLFQAKKNAVHKVGKDMSTSVGGKSSRVIRGNSDDSVDGNRATTTRGEHSEFNQGNKSTLTLQSAATHAANIINQSQGEIIQASNGNTIISAKGKATVVADGNVHVESKADAHLKAGSKIGVQAGSDIDVKSGAAISSESSGDTNVKAGGKAMITSGGSTDIKASGAVNVDGSTVNLNSGLAGTAPAADSVEAESTATVETPPTQLSRDGNSANSDGNLDAEQTTRGELDAAEAQDEAGSSGSSAPGSIGSSGGVQQANFTPGQVNSAVSPTSLGNYKGDACAIANDLVARGWSPEGASAIVGNMMRESNLNPLAYNANDVGQPSGGLVQWRGDRLSALQSYSAANGKDWRTTDAQLDYLDHEARTTHSGTGGAGLISGAGGINQAIYHAASYERYAGWNTGSQEFNERAGNAGGVYNECFGNNVDKVGGQDINDISGYQGGDTDSTAQGTDDMTGGTGQGEIAPTKGTKAPYAEGSESGAGINWGQKVSPNFTLGQLCPTSKFHVGQNPTGSGAMISHDQLIRNLSTVAMNVLEPMLTAFGKVHVMSGYRSLAYNNSLRARGGGAAKNSDHIRGQAVDVQIPGVAPARVAAWVEKNIPTAAGVGRYPSFTHVSYYEGGNGGRMRHWGHS